MNLGNLIGCVKKEIKSIETSIEDQEQYILSSGEKCLNVAGTVAAEGGSLIAGGIEEIGDGVKAVGEGAVNCVNLVDDGVENILKLKRMCQNIYELAFRFKGYLEDDSLIESTLALVVWLALCYFFQIWMIPVVILIIYIKNLIMYYIFGENVEDEKTMAESVKAKMEAVEEVVGLVRAIIGKLEVILQKVFGFINLKSLHLSWIAILIQVVVTLILMYIPINFLLMLWGISLYSKKFLKNKNLPDKKGEKGAETVVEATEELQGVAGDFLTLNITKGISHIKDAFGKLSSKCD